MKRETHNEAVNLDAQIEETKQNIVRVKGAIAHCEAGNAVELSVKTFGCGGFCLGLILSPLKVLRMELQAQQAQLKKLNGQFSKL